MRVTKVLKEYAEKEISKKMEAKIDELWAEHKAHKEKMEAELEKIRQEADKKALSILKAYGYHKRYGKSEEEFFEYYIGNWKHEDFEELDKKDDEIRAEYNKKLEMFILEMELDGDKEKFFEALAKL